MRWHIYDYFDHSHEQQYWRGQGESMPPPPAREVLSLVTARFGIIKANEWSGSDYLGGLLVADGIGALFRIYNGGRDHNGRPHRWVLLLACGPVADFAGLDVISALESPVLRTYGLSPVASPAPFPSLAPDFTSAKSLATVPGMATSFEGDGSEAEGQARTVSRQLTQMRGRVAGSLLVEHLGEKARVWCKIAAHSTSGRLTDSDRSRGRTLVDPEMPAGASAAYRVAGRRSQSGMMLVGAGVLAGLIVGVGVTKLLRSDPAPGGPLPTASNAQSAAISSAGAPPSGGMAAAKTTPGAAKAKTVGREEAALAQPPVKFNPAMTEEKRGPLTLEDLVNTYLPEGWAVSYSIKGSKVKAHSVTSRNNSIASGEANGGGEKNQFVAFIDESLEKEDPKGRNATIVIEVIVPR